ncbi:non-canonical purine NTP pyrophosphatase, rdgB/HAM1 family [Geitlerinema sp. PCC 7407]|nr:non-canonical purine NTP pyrophosphatase, rdgB/HAM1 family [Geitlerinema sp. PCC 7407]
MNPNLQLLQSMMKRLIVATGNPGKLKEMQSYLADVPVTLELKPAELDVDETGLTFAENACLKASEIARATGEWAIADDSGLAVDALEGAPGVFSARYGKTDAERIERLLGELGNELDRAAQFVCVVAIARPDGAIALQAEGICPGEILHAPRGEAGFGYDPVFYVPEHRLSFAEMSPDLKRSVSHRGRAFDQLLPKLRSLMASQA